MGLVCNAMVDQLNTITHEVTRVAREVGLEGRLSGHANVEGACGSWRDLMDKVIICISSTLPHGIHTLSPLPQVNIVAAVLTGTCAI